MRFSKKKLEGPIYIVFILQNEWHLKFWLFEERKEIGRQIYQARILFAIHAWIHKGTQLTSTILTIVTWVVTTR